MADTSALQESLFRDFRPQIFIHTGRYFWGREDREDATQETFVKAGIALPRALARGNFQPQNWLLRIATNVCLDVVRHRRVVTEVSVETMTMESGEPIDTWLAPDDTEQTVLQRELRSEILDSLHRLTPYERTIFLQHYLLGSTHDEIGVRFKGKSRLAIKSAGIRGRRQFMRDYQALRAHQQQAMSA